MCNKIKILLLNIFILRKINISILTKYNINNITICVPYVHIDKFNSYYKKKKMPKIFNKIFS